MKTVIVNYKVNGKRVKFNVIKTGKNLRMRLDNERNILIIRSHVDKLRVLKNGNMSCGADRFRLNIRKAVKQITGDSMKIKINEVTL